MEVLEGIPVSEGIVTGTVVVLDDARARVKRRSISAKAVDAEIERFDQALAASLAELDKVYAITHDELGPEAAKIFLFHQGMLRDPTLIEPIRAMIRDERVSAKFATSEVFHDFARKLSAQHDSIFTTKTDDLRDMASRVIAKLAGEQADPFAQLEPGSIVIARDLTPSQAVALGRNKAVALVTDLGGRTSHTAIVARALRLPAVVGCRWATQLAENSMPAIVDGDEGTVVLDPDKPTRDRYDESIEHRRVFHLSLGELAHLEPITTDGVRIHLHGNIEFPDEASDVLAMGGSGVGLYRTEFLYLTSDTEPTEDDHYASYAKCIKLLEGKPLTIRTVDLGADKYTQARTEIPERNPFLGCRSIRYCLRSLPMFKTQLRAILRAAALGPVRVMFPLITSIDEFRQARMFLLEAGEDLAEEGISHSTRIPIGMMAEVPSAAVMASVFAREVDFFSIGTNDLVQYTLAVDRTNERVAHLYEPAHPAVIRLIREITKAGRRHEIPVSCCGEAAGDLQYALLLLGLGVRTLSVTAQSIPQLKRMIRSVQMDECERIAQKAFRFDSAAQVAALLRDRARKIVPEAFDGRSAD